MNIEENTNSIRLRRQNVIALTVYIGIKRTENTVDILIEKLLTVFSVIKPIHMYDEDEFW